MRKNQGHFLKKSAQKSRALFKKKCGKIKGTFLKKVRKNQGHFLKSAQTSRDIFKKVLKNRVLRMSSIEFHSLTCPHCSGTIIVYPNELNCRIFRHGVYRATNEPIPPHTSKDECDRLVLENLIHGCGKPFMVNNEIQAVACDYI